MGRDGEEYEEIEEWSILMSETESNITSKEFKENVLKSCIIDGIMLDVPTNQIDRVVDNIERNLKECFYLLHKEY